MFESELAQTRTRIEGAGSQSGRIWMRPPVTREQVTAYEKSLGLPLPDELREFVCQIADGIGLGYNVSMSMLPLLNEIRYPGGEHPARLVVFPIQQILREKGTDPPGYPIAGTQYARGWNELTGHEKMESEIALHFGMWEGEEIILVLSGPERGKVWVTSRFGGFRKPKGLTFFPALDHILKTIS